MKLLLYWAGISLLALNAPTATQQLEGRNACSFKVSESATKPSMTGPDDVVALAYVVEQPDSPVEILSIDFKDSFVSVANERFTEKLRYTVKVRNRSDQPIRSFDITARVTPTGAGFGFVGVGLGSGGLSTGGILAPGQGDCRGRRPWDRGRSRACGGCPRIGRWRRAGNCSYIRSRRYPYPLGASAKP